MAESKAGIEFIAIISHLQQQQIRYFAYNIMLHLQLLWWRRYEGLVEIYKVNS